MVNIFSKKPKKLKRTLSTLYVLGHFWLTLLLIEFQLNRYAMLTMLTSRKKEKRHLSTFPCTG